MNVDSEINIALENGQIACGLRQQLWGLHTSPIAAEGAARPAAGNADATGQRGPELAFIAWTQAVQDNQAQRDANGKPSSSLIEFFRSSKDRSYKD